MMCDWLAMDVHCDGMMCDWCPMVVRPAADTV